MGTLARIAKLRRLVADPGYRIALMYGIGASVELELLPFGDHIRTVIDVGANRGQFAAFALRRFPDAAVHSFEPLPGPAERLARYARGRGDGRVSVRRVALGASGGSHTMHVASEDDSSSLLAFGDAQVRLGTREVARVDVEVRRLDEVMQPSDLRPATLLKVDVQGTELDVLRGSEDLLGAVDEILVECSYIPFYDGQALAPEVAGYLRDQGFIRRWELPSIRDGVHVLQADILFGRGHVS